MSHTNSTTNYGLPQFITTDKPAWLTDVNTAYSDIDAQMKTNADAATTAGNNAIQALSDAATASTSATNANNKADGIIASVSDIFDPTAAYTVDSIVIYNNLLYICTVAVTVPGPWTGSANWDRITVEDLINTKADATAIPTRVSQLSNDAGYLTMSTTPLKVASISWGTALNVNEFKYQYLLISSTFIFVIWLAGTSDVNIRNIGTDNSANGSGSATMDGVTVVRSSTGISITLNYNSAITVIY